MNYDYFVTNFGLNSNTGYLPSSINPSPSLDFFPDYIANNLTQFNTQYLIIQIYTYFTDMTSDYETYSISRITAAGEDTTLLIDTYTQLMLDAEWQESAKVPSNGSLFSISKNIGTEQVLRFLDLFNKLYTESSNDPCVDEYANAILSKAIFKLSQNHNSMGNGTRLKKVIALISSGIGPTALSKTKQALINLESYSIQLFPGSITQYPNLKTPSQKLRSQIMINSITEDRYNILQGGTLKNEKLQSYITSTTRQISTLQSPSVPQNWAYYFSSYIIGFFKRVFYRSGFRQTIVRGTASLIATTMSANPQNKMQSSGISNLNISVTQDQGELYVNFSGNLGYENIGGSFSISANSIRYITYSAIYHAQNLSNEYALRIVEKIGSEDINAETIYASYLVFLYSYLSIVVYCMLNPDNIFSISIDPVGRDNLNFALTRDFMNQMYQEFQDTYPSQPREIQNIMNYASPIGWSSLIFDWK